MGNRDGQEYVLALDVADAGKAALVDADRRGASQRLRLPRSAMHADGRRRTRLRSRPERRPGLPRSQDRRSSSGGTTSSATSAARCRPGATAKACSSTVRGSLCTPGGDKASIAALSKTTGETVWSSPIGDRAGYASIVTAEIAGVKQYVQFMDAGVFGVAAKDGAPLWRYDAPANGTANISTALVCRATSSSPPAATAPAAARPTSRKRGDDVHRRRKVLHARHEEPSRRHGRSSTVTSTAAPIPAFSRASNWRPAKRSGKNARRANARSSTSTANSSRAANAGKVCLVNVSPTGCEIVGEFDRSRPQRQTKLAAPGRRQRQALPARSRRVELLRAKEMNASADYTDFADEFVFQSASSAKSAGRISQI